MAIINSVFIGRAKKSAGNATFRTVRGRTIASQKVAKKGTQNGMHSSNQYALACISRFASLYASDINLSFDPTTYGSSRNAFFKLNYAAMKKAINPLYVDSLKHGADKIPADSEIIAAIETYAAANPTAIYRVKKHGLEAVYLTGAWSSEDNPSEEATDLNQVRISVLASPAEGGSVTGGGVYAIGTEVTISAVAAEEYEFESWSDGDTNSSRTIAAYEKVTYTANFKKVPNKDIE